jgi:4'-phosphopantetheinyl transferase
MPRNFTQNEIKQIENCSLQNKSRQFYNIWTLKESYIKMIGQGLSMPLDSFSFDTSNINSIRIITENLDTSDVYSQLFYPDTGHVMAVCLKDHNKKILPYRISIDELFPLY